MARSKKTDDVKKLPANKIGRPSLFEEKSPLAIEYLMGGWVRVGDSVPSISGVACFMGVNRDTVNEWAKSNKEFSGTIASIMTMQERELTNKTLCGDFNAPFAKLLMTRHGYSDKVEQDVKSSDGSMTPKGVTLDDFYAQAKSSGK